MQKIPFSVVTTCRNEMKSLPRWMQNILEQTRQPDEVVIVDAFSDDGTFEYLADWAKENPRIKVLQEKGAAAHGRNVAIKNARFEHILSTDMGVRLAPVWCEELIAPFEKDPTVEVVAGNTCVDIDIKKASAAARAEYYIENGGIQELKPGFIIGNRSSAYLKKIWEDLGGLPEDLTFYADDSVFGRQIIEKNYKMAFAPKAMTFWSRPQKIKDFWKEQRNYGRGGGEANIKKPYFFRLHENQRVPWFLAIFANALWNMVKQSKVNAIKKAVVKGDFGALFMIAVLTFGNGWYRMIGYKAGFVWGNIHCNNCRNRLTQKW